MTRAANWFALKMRQGASARPVLARPLPYVLAMRGVPGHVRNPSSSPGPDVDRPPRTIWGSRTSLHVLAACGVVVMMRFAAPLLLPIVLSVMLFYMLDPIVDTLQRWHVPRLLGSLVVVFGLVGALGAGASFLWPQIDSVLVKVPAGTEQLRRTLRQNRR